MKKLVLGFHICVAVVLVSVVCAVAQTVGADPAPAAPTGWVALLTSVLPIVLSATGLGFLSPFVAPVFRVIQAIRDRHQLQTSDAGFSSLAREIADGIGFVAADKGVTAVTKDHASDIADTVNPDLVERLKLTREQLKQKVVAELGKRILARIAA